MFNTIRELSSDEPQPYTEGSTYLINLDKFTKIKCNYCHYTTMCNLPAPKCGICKHEMITVLDITHTRIE